MANIEPSMTSALSDAVGDINKDDPNTQAVGVRYAQPRHRLVLPGNGELEGIQAEMRKTLNDLLDQNRRLMLYCDNQKIAIESMQRGVG